MNGQRIIEEICKQDMLKDAIPNEEGGHIFVWSANAEEQLEAIMAEGAKPYIEMLIKWKKWADMGIEEFLPEWVRPVLHKTYEDTDNLLSR